MSSHPSGRRWSTRLAAASTLVLVLHGSVSRGPDPSPEPDGLGSEAAAPPTVVDGPVREQGVPAPPPTPPTTPPPPPPPVVDPQAADPVRVEIAALGVDAPIVPLGLDEAGELEAPADTDDAGWWTEGPEPGEKGPAVIAGHLDSLTGPAVFYGLDALTAGDVISVVRADQSRVQFAVVRTEQHAKDAFPTGAVYGATAGAELRLVTCGGAFERSTGHYLDNVIVFASRI